MTKFRQWFTSTGTEVVAGKNAENNEELVEQVGKGETVLHTERPGSPFVNIKRNKPSKTDIYDAALFCAKHSHTWKEHKNDIKIHVFKKEDIYKEEKMKVGTFGVKKFKAVIAKKQDIGKI